MRSITSTLRAAMKSWQARPTVRLIIQDRRTRWTTLHTLSSATDTRVDLCSDGNGHLYAVRADGSGNVQLCIITNPGTQSQWNNWTTIVAADAVVYGDVAIEHMGGNNLRVAYVGSPYRIKAVESSDLGQNWGAPVAIVTGLTATPSVALSGDCCFLWGGGYLCCYESAWGAGAWSGPTNWSGTNSYTLVYGIAAVTKGAKERLLYAADGSIYAGWYDPAGNSFSSRYRVQPGADQTPTSKADPTVPSLVAPSDVIATWVEDHQGSPESWKYPIQRIAVDADAIHYGSEVPMCVDTTTDNRLALAYDASTHKLYAANEQIVLQAKVYQENDSAMHIGPLEALSYERETVGLRPGALDVQFLDAQGDYRGMGRSGETAEAIKPLSTVILRRGYRTASGDEYEDLDPHYIVQARRSEGRGGGRFQLECVDGFGLLGLWHPPETLTWNDRSIKWLMDELAAKVGLTVLDDGNAAFTRTLAAFSLYPSQSAYLGFHALLRLAGAVARIGEEGTLDCIYLPDYAPASKPDVGDAGEIREGVYGTSRYAVTSLRVISDQAASEGEDIAASQLMGCRFHRMLEDYRIATQAVADQVRDRELALAAARARYEWVETPARIDLELYDIVNLHAHADAIPSDDRERTLVSIRERYDAVRGRYISELTLSAC